MERFLYLWIRWPFNPTGFARSIRIYRASMIEGLRLEDIAHFRPRMSIVDQLPELITHRLQFLILSVSHDTIMPSVTLRTC